MTIGEKIKFFRKERGITQNELSLLSGVACPTIQKYETNKYLPKQSTLNKLATGLNIPVQCFLSIPELLESQSDYFYSLDIGKRLRILRLCAGYSYSDLANDILVVQGKEFSATMRELSDLIENIKACERGNMIVDPELAEFLSGIFHVPYDIFLTEEQVKTPSEDTMRKYFMELYKDMYTDIEKEFQSSTFYGKYRKLNFLGRQKIAEIIDDLSQLEKYTAPDPDSENEE